MKHYLPILSAFVILFSSCSKEDDLFEDIITEVPTLCVKRTVDYSSEWNVNTKISEYNYNGTQLLDWTYTRISDNSTTVSTYTNTYTGNNITSMLVCEPNGTTLYDFEYDNLDRVTKQFKDDTLEFTYTYTGYIVEKHDTSGTLIEEHTYDSGYNLILIKTKLATDSSWTSIYENTHDNKNMPFKNVDSWYPLSGYRYVSPNNTTSITNILPVGNNMSMNISYGINDFPTYIETTYSDGRSKSETLEYNN